MKHKFIWPSHFSCHMLTLPFSSFLTHHTIRQHNHSSPMVICLLEINLFYHLLRLIDTPVSHPTAKYGTGLIANWANHVVLANHTCAPSCVGSSTTLSSSELVTNASASQANGPRFAVHQPPGLELGPEDEILAFLTDLDDLNTDQKMGPPKSVSTLIHFLFC